MNTVAEQAWESIERAIEAREFNKQGLWGDQRMSYDESVDLSLASLRAHAADYPTWIVSYSGGKDSSAALAFVVWAIQQKHVPAPERLIVLYADTGMELPPLFTTAMKTLDAVRGMGYDARHVKPPLDKRFFVYMLGRGVPPPRRNQRWCTERLKAEPITAAQKELYTQYGDKAVNLTGVRIGESAIRDSRILMSCSSNDGECGQGWFQKSKNALAPLMHWRVCHIWRWIYRSDNPLKSTRDIADVYLYDEFQDIRTGCIECFIVDTDWAFKGVLRKPQWAHLRPLTGLRPLYNELLEAKHRHRKVDPKDTRIEKFGALGALTMQAREYALEKVLAMQKAANYSLIDAEEEARIRELWRLDTYPRGWTGKEPVGTDAYERVYADGSKQLLLPFVVGAA